MWCYQLECTLHSFPSRRCRRLHRILIVMLSFRAGLLTFLGAAAWLAKQGCILDRLRSPREGIYGCRHRIGTPLILFGAEGHTSIDQGPIWRYNATGDITLSSVHFFRGPIRT